MAVTPSRRSKAAGKPNQPRPASAGARHPVPSSAVRDWFAARSGIQENSRAGSAAKRGYGRKWRKLAATILERDPYCMADGCNEWSTEVDHIKPRRDGGTDDPENLQGMCHDCHSRKTAIEDGRWGYAPQGTSHRQT